MGYREAPRGWWEDFVPALPARTGKLAVVRADGSPQVVPVWVDLVVPLRPERVIAKLDIAS